MPSKPDVLKERRLNDPEFAARLRSYAAKYREENRAKERERQRILKAKKREADREGYNAYMREYNSKNQPIRERKAKAVREANPEYAERRKTLETLSRADHEKHWSLKRKYGIGLDDWTRIKDSQSNSCAVCGVHESESGKKGLAVDHCHTEGQVRGLLCGNCNTGLGQFKDDVALLQKAIQYLNKFKE